MAHFFNLCECSPKLVLVCKEDFIYIANNKQTYGEIYKHKEGSIRNRRPD